MKVADNLLQLFGGYGYMSEYPISRFFVDARIQRIYGGTNEIMKEIVARSLLENKDKIKSLLPQAFYFSGVKLSTLQLLL